MPHTARQHGKALLALSLFVQLAAYVAASMAQAQEPASRIPAASPATDLSIPPAIAIKDENTAPLIASASALSIIGAPDPLPSSTALRLKENSSGWSWLSLDGGRRPSFNLYQDKSSRLALSVNGNGSIRLKYKLAW